MKNLHLQLNLAENKKGKNADKIKMVKFALSLRESIENTNSQPNYKFLLSFKFLFYLPTKLYFCAIIECGVVVM